MLQNFLRTGHAYTAKYAKGRTETKALTSQYQDNGERTLTLPTPHQDILERVITDYSPLRRVARITSITSDRLELLVEQGQGDVGWVSEVGARDETDAPELTKVTIHAHELFAKPRASQKLLDDSHVDVEAWLMQKIAEQMGRKETDAFVMGDGQGKPKGFLTYPSVDLHDPKWEHIETHKTGADGALLESDVLIDVFHAMKPEYLSNAVWMMSRAALSMIRKLKDKDGNYIWTPSVSADGVSQLLGHDVVLCESMPAPSKDSLSIVFANMSEAYHIVERQDVNVLRDPYSAKPYVEFYATKRVGGDVVNFEAIKRIQFSAHDE